MSHLCLNKGSLEFRMLLPCCPWLSVLSYKPTVAEVRCRIWLTWDRVKESVRCRAYLLTACYHSTGLGTDVQVPTWFLKASGLLCSLHVLVGFSYEVSGRRWCVRGAHFPLYGISSSSQSPHKDMNGNHGCENLKHLLICEPVNHSVTRKDPCRHKEPRFFGA